jgi:hypothetical protein
MALFRRAKGSDAAPPTATESFPLLVDVVPRVHVRVRGQVFKIKLRPSEGMPALEVTIIDDSGSAVIVWSGRRSIGGVGLGRRMVVEGVPTMVGKKLTFTNPTYELR